MAGLNGEDNPAMQRLACQITDMRLEKTVPESKRLNPNEMVTPQQPQETQVSDQVTMNS